MSNFNTLQIEMESKLIANCNFYAEEGLKLLTKGNYQLLIENKHDGYILHSLIVS
jgi:hypothetical protein